MSDTIAHLASLLPHATLLDVQDELMRQLRQHRGEGNAPMMYRFCPCARCNSLETIRQALLDWIEGDLWHNH